MYKILNLIVVSFLFGNFVLATELDTAESKAYRELFHTDGIVSNGFQLENFGVDQKLEQRASDFLADLSSDKKEKVFQIIEAQFINYLSSQLGKYYQGMALERRGIVNDSVTNLRENGGNLYRSLKISKANGLVLSTNLKEFLKTNETIINVLKEAELKQ